MKNTLVVLAVLVLGSLASAQTFGFLNAAGTSLYCDYEVLSPATAYGKTVWQSVHNLAVCGYPVNATMVGAGGGGTFKDVSQKTKAKVKIKGVLLADNLYDAGTESYSGAQWFMTSNLTASSTEYGWYGIGSFSGSIFGDNFGYLTTTIPGPHGEHASGGLINGMAKAGQ